MKQSEILEHIQFLWQIQNRTSDAVILANGFEIFDIIRMKLFCLWKFLPLKSVILGMVGRFEPGPHSSGQCQFDSGKNK